MLDLLELSLTIVLAFISSLKLEAKLASHSSIEERALFHSVGTVGFVCFNLLIIGAVGLFGLHAALLTQSILLALIMAYFKGHRREELTKPASPDPLNHPWSVIGVAICSICLAGLAREALHSYPYEDSANHHVPLALWYIKHGSIYKPDVGTMPLYPANVSLLYGILLSTVSGYLLLGLLNVMACGVLGLSAFIMCRHFGVPRGVAIWAPALVLGNQVLSMQVHSLYIDAFFAASIGAGICFALLYQDKKNLFCLIGSGTAIGIALGSKPQGVFYAALVGIILLSAIMRERSPKPLLVFGRRAVAWLLPVFLLGGYWYVRNATLTANIAQTPSNLGVAYIIEHTSLLWSMDEYISTFGVLGIVKSFAGQTSSVSVAGLIPCLWLICSDAVARRKRSSARYWPLTIPALACLAFLLIHPYSSKVYLDMPLNPDLAQLRYGLVAVMLLNCCWVIACREHPAFLPVLCAGLFLPSGRIVLAVGLAGAGVIYALASSWNAGAEAGTTNNSPAQETSENGAARFDA